MSDHTVCFKLPGYQCIIMLLYDQWERMAVWLNEVEHTQLLSSHRRPCAIILGVTGMGVTKQNGEC